jgi:hypothetical protein
MKTPQPPLSRADSLNQEEMEKLRRAFDDRLVCISDASSIDRVRDLMNQEVKLNGMLKAGDLP